MIDKLQNLQRGERLVYYSGTTPYIKPESFEMAMMLYERGRVYLVSKLIGRTIHPESFRELGTFEYIAIGR